jgi:hypothetical protein
MTGVPSAAAAETLVGTTLAPGVVNSSLTTFGDVPLLNVKGATSEIRFFDRDGSNDYSGIFRNANNLNFFESGVGTVASINGSGIVAGTGICIRCTSTARPPVFGGTLIYEVDTKRLLIHDGTAWVVLFAKGYYTPSFGNFYPGWNPTFNWEYTPGQMHINGWLDFRAGSAFYGSDAEGFGATLPPGFSVGGASGATPMISKCSYYINGWQVFYGAMNLGPNPAYPLAYCWDRSSGTAPWTTWSSFCHYVSPATWNIGSTMMMHAVIPGTLAP